MFFSRYVKSGTTRSTPSISSSGNARPQSTINISFEHSYTYKFFPISFKPPSAINLTGVLLLSRGFFSAERGCGFARPSTGAFDMAGALLLVNTGVPGCLYFLAGAAEEADALRYVFLGAVCETGAVTDFAHDLLCFFAMFSVSVNNLLFDNNPINVPFSLCKIHKNLPKFRIVTLNDLFFAPKRVKSNCGIGKKQNRSPFSSRSCAISMYLCKMLMYFWQHFTIPKTHNVRVSGLK